MIKGRPGRARVRPHPGGAGPAPPASRRHRGGEPAARPVRYGVLLLVLVFTYLLSAFIATAWILAVQIVLFVSVAWLAAHTSDLPRRTARAAFAAVTGGSVIAAVLALTHPSDEFAGIANLWTALVLMFSAVLIVRRVLAQPTVTMQSIFGAVSAYLILGLMFAACYAAIYRFDGNTFFVSGRGNVKTFQYFSFTTLTTLGYGDYTAARPGGQAVAVIEALLGQVFLATLVARLVAAFRPEQRPARRARPARAEPPRPGRQHSGQQQRQRQRANRPSSPGRARPGHRSRSRPER